LNYNTTILSKNSNNGSKTINAANKKQEQTLAYKKILPKALNNNIKTTNDLKLNNITKLISNNNIINKSNIVSNNNFNKLNKCNIDLNLNLTLRKNITQTSKNQKSDSVSTSSKILNTNSDYPQKKYT